MFILSLMVTSLPVFGFSPQMLKFKVSFNQKRKVSQLMDVIGKLNLSQDSKKFYKSIVNEYSNNELPMIEFNGPNLIFKYQNQRSVGEVNIEKDLLLIDDRRITLDHYPDARELYGRINKTISQKEGDAFLMFISSENRNKASLLNSKLQALFWTISVEFAKSHIKTRGSRSLANKKN
jgi:hypothetical protein